MGNLHPMLWLASAVSLLLTLSGCSTVPVSGNNANNTTQGRQASIPQALPNHPPNRASNHSYSPPQYVATTQHYAQNHNDTYTRTMPINYQRPPAPSGVPSSVLRSMNKQTHVTPQRHALLTAAHRSMGVPYLYGGTSPKSGFDCSGFTQHSYQSVNVKIPRTAAQQSAASRTIRRQDLRPGDMIFFKTSGRKVNHVGIYVGNGKFIHAASGGGRVTTDDLRKNYWQKRLHKYGRVLS